MILAIQKAQSIAARVALLFVLISLQTCIVFSQQRRPIDSSEEASTRKFLQNYVGSVNELNRTTKYRLASIDLNLDGKNEIVVYLTGPGFCGSGGCTMLVLASKGLSYHVVSRTTIAHLPIKALSSKSNGWTDLSVLVAGGGILNGYPAKLPFDGRKYPLNPTISPAKKINGDNPGTLLLSEQDKEYPIYP